MSEWKELKIDNLPPDILTGDYEFNYGDKYSGEKGNFELDARSEIKRRVSILGAYINKNESSYVRYRKPEPKAPTHEEIMTKWWKCDNGRWCKIVGYDPNSKKRTYLDCFSEWESKRYFTNRESADIPPESE